MRILGIREHPELLEEGARFFNMAFGGQNSYGLYFDCIKASLTTKSPLPRWYLMMDDKKIAAGCGIITNDFISRMDLWPWLCALYVRNEYRGRSLSEQLLAHATAEAGRLGFEQLYLTTTLDGFYEKYGWTRIEDGFSVLDGPSRIYIKPTSESIDG
jgi:GNAT superfamily N-acetyltransferase